MEIPPITCFQQSFCLGVLGAFTVYLANFRDKRLKSFLSDGLISKGMLNFLIWDIIFFLLGGGLTTMLFLYPKDFKEAALCGAGWQGVVGGLAAGAHHDIESTKEKTGRLVKQHPELKSKLDEKLKEGKK